MTPKTNVKILEQGNLLPINWHYLAATKGAT
jgi:hypothetical protein